MMFRMCSRAKLKGKIKIPFVKRAGIPETLFEAAGPRDWFYSASVTNGSIKYTADLGRNVTEILEN